MFHLFIIHYFLHIMHGSSTMGDQGLRKKMTMADFLSPPSATMTNAVLPVPQHLPSLPYTVRATKKGGVPCAVESRKHHKVVVLTNIEGNVTVLLSALQKALGTGGVRKENSIEVQGAHHLEKIKNFVIKSGCMVGVSKQLKTEAAAVGASKKTNKGSSNNTNINSDKNQATTTAKSAATATANVGCLPLSVKEIKAMKPTEMKVHLDARQLSTQGNKKELLARLLTMASTVPN